MKKITSDQAVFLFDEYLDDSGNCVVILGKKYYPSKVLAAIDDESYKDGLKEFISNLDDYEIED